MPYTADIRILGGLPVTVAFNVQPREEDVGIFGEWVNDWWITHVNGRPYKGKWIEKRLTAQDCERIAVELQEGDYRL